MMYPMKPSLQKVVLALTLTGALSPCAARAEEEEAKARLVTPLSLGLTSSLQYPTIKDGKISVYGLRAGVCVEWNIPDTLITEVSGISIGLLAMMDTHVVKGVQLVGFFNHATEMSGIQLGLNNLSNDAYGARLGALNIAGNAASGLELGIINYAFSLKGVQVGAINLSENDVYGVQVGIANVTENVNGLQFGILNFASSLKGVQVGLFNTHGDSCFPLLMVGW